MPLTLEYRRGTLSASELSQIVEQTLGEYQSDQELREMIGEVEKVTSDVIQVEDRSAHLDPAVATLIVTFGGPVFLDVWRHVLLPRLKRRFGADAIGPEAEGADQGNKK